LYEAAEKASNAVYPDPRTACFYARRALELAVQWIYKYDYSLLLPYQENLSALIHEPTFKKLRERHLQQSTGHYPLGNEAVHSNSSIQAYDSVTAGSELSTLPTGWHAPMREKKSLNPGLSFNPDDLPKQQSLEQTIEHFKTWNPASGKKDENSLYFWPTNPQWTKNSNACGAEVQRQRSFSPTAGHTRLFRS